MTQQSTIGPFALVPRWVLRRLHSKPWAVMLYAIIADHADRSEGGDGGWTMSREAIAEEMGTSVGTVGRALRDVRDADVIRIVQQRVPGTKELGWSRYYVVQAESDTYDPTPHAGDRGSDTCDRGSDAGETDIQEPPSRTPDNNTSLVSDEQRAATELCEALADSIESRGGRRPTVTATWIADMERLIRIDGRHPDDITKVIRWLHEGRDDISSFWQANIRSPRKLRTKWDQMREQYARQTRPTPRTAPGMNAVYAHLRSAQ